MSRFEFTSSKGVPFAVRLVKKGDRYGLHNKLVYAEADPMVEFYSLTHPEKFGAEGQFVSRYNASTLLGEDRWSKGQDLGKTGLCLYGSEPLWSVDAASMRAVLDYVRTNR